MTVVAFCYFPPTDLAEKVTENQEKIFQTIPFLYTVPGLSTQNAVATDDETCTSVPSSVEKISATHRNKSA